MSINTLMSIRFDKYFALLDKLVPMASGFVVCDSEGMIVASHGETFVIAPADCRADGCCAQPNDTQHPEVDNVLAAADGRLLLRRAILNNAGNPVGTLLACIHSELSEDDYSVLDAVTGSIEAAASCISKEYELTSELDAMAQELAGRYEELNLVYESNDDIVEYNEETDTVNQLLRNCVDYLNVGLVAMISPAQDEIHYAVSSTAPVKDPYPLLQHFARDLYSKVTAEQTCLIVNDLSDKQRVSLSLNLPYKILTCPVHDGQGSAVANLICLNHLTGSDFFNSDKNLLCVMSRKLSKIINANHDTMTGLINMRALLHVLQDAIKSAYRKGVSHVYLNVDLDQLSVINDNLGRAVGDEAIKTVSTLLKNRIRATDTISYLGEGRFGVVMEMCSLDQGMQVAENLCQAVKETPFSAAEEDVELSVSVGLALIGPDASGPDSVLETAEMARDAAKKAGRNQVKVYSSDNSELTERKQQMQVVNRIQKALRNNRFSIYCQEIRPAAESSEKYHFEILVRMNGEDGEMIPPDMFIPAAEHYNLMPSLDRWVIDNTFALLHANGMAQQPREGVVSINLSGQSLADEKLVVYIEDMFRKYPLLPNCICFEITETSALGNIKSAKDIIVRLRKIGCHFSLDDFGTGLSSFSYLKELPVDFLKIDGSFVRAILDDRISHAMVSSINHIGHVMGLKTVAEFVENEEIVKQLQQIGVDYLQGYSIGKPVPLQQYLVDIGLTAVPKAG
ncbi:MAG: EAL domain-containing protein [Gammaproteobacteria bacterium]